MLKEQKFPRSKSTAREGREEQINLIPTFFGGIRKEFHFKKKFCHPQFVIDWNFYAHLKSNGGFIGMKTQLCLRKRMDSFIVIK